MNTEIIPTITLIPDKDEVIKVTREKKPKSTLTYRKIGDGNMSRYHQQSINLLREMETLSKPAIQFLNTLIDGMRFDYQSGEVIIEVYYKPETNIEKLMVSRGFKELFARDLVRRTRRSHYVVNPYAIVTNTAKQLVIWGKAKKLQTPK